MDSADAGIITEPPVLTVKTDRTQCEHCQEALHPNVYHQCAGNEEHTPPVQEPTCRLYTDGFHRRRAWGKCECEMSDQEIKAIVKWAEGPTSAEKPYFTQAPQS
jgi:hypothetical protein